jgi:HEAT repeat protein
MVPHAVALLADPRWFVVRNMLSLLRQTGVWLPLRDLEPALAHADARVRAEAVRCLTLAAPPASVATLERLIGDEDERVAETVVALVGSGRLAAGREPLVAMLRRPDPLGRHRALRLKALQALGELGDRRVLAELRPYFRSWLPVVSADERRAAFASLVRYPQADRVPLLQQGLRSRDPAVRALCRQLLDAPTAGSGETT